MGRPSLKIYRGLILVKPRMNNVSDCIMINATSFALFLYRTKIRNDIEVN